MTFNMNQHKTTPALQPRSYGFQELAVLYFPNITPASATVRLKQWIKDCPALMDELAAHSWRITARLLTPAQVQLIVAAFGSPF